MKIYVWQRVDKASDNYHPQGGVVVFAETLERAHELAAAEGASINPEKEPPDQVRATEGDEACYIMPDAGCC